MHPQKRRTYNAAEKDLAARLITDINGVKSVVNNMTIDESMSKNN